MSRNLSVFLGTVLMVVVMGPVISFAGKSADKHDCRQERPRGPYICERGPLAGRTFATKKAMIEALRNGSATPVTVTDKSTGGSGSSKAKASMKK